MQKPSIMFIILSMMILVCGGTYVYHPPWVSSHQPTINRPAPLGDIMSLETIDLSQTTDPMQLFNLWRNEARNLSLNSVPDAMTISTIKSGGGIPARPASRTVLLRDLSDEGFKLYTDYTSQKGQDILENPNVSLVFVWMFRKPDGVTGNRQVRVEGIAERLPVEESRAYFNSEPIEAQIRTVIQRQSQRVTDNRKFLIEESARLWQLYQDDPTGFKLEMPLTWGGYIVKPRMIEFYQGTRDALNDRIRFLIPDPHNSELEPGQFPGANGWIYEQLEP